MKTLQIDETKARGLYKKASAEFKSMLEDTFGQKFFQQSVLDRIKTFEDACHAQAMDPDDFYEECEDADLSVDEVNYRKLKIIAAALNEDWTPDFTNRGQKKWFPWHRVENAGLVYSCSTYSATTASTDIGSRLCCRDEKTATYFGTQFLEEWAGFLL